MTDPILEKSNGQRYPYPNPDETLWAMAAHLSVLLNLFTGFLGMAAALVIYLVYKDKSKYVAFNALQSLILQLICWVAALIAASVFWGLIGGLLSAMWTAIGALSSIVIGIIFIPFGIVITIALVLIPVFFIILPIINIVYSIIGSIHCKNGEDFQYWKIGDWIRLKEVDQVSL